MDVAALADDEELLAMNDALDKLAAQNQVEAELVKLRYFVGMTLEEAAEVLGISARTADNYWIHARAWLFREIKASPVSIRSRNVFARWPGAAASRHVASGRCEKACWSGGMLNFKYRGALDEESWG